MSKNRGRPVLPDEDVRSEYIGFRVKGYEYEAIKAAAERAGMTAPVWARTVIVHAASEISLESVRTKSNRQLLEIIARALAVNDPEIGRFFEED